MGRDEAGPRAGLQDGFQETLRVQAQHRPSVGGEAADPLQAALQGLRRLESRQQDQVVHLARAVPAAVDRAHFGGEQETRCCGVGTKPEQALFRGGEA